MKKSIIASLAVIAGAATLATFALSGAGKFGNVQVNADAAKYSVTFDAESTIEAVDNGIYAIYGTTPRGAKVGVVGFDDSEAYFHFKGVSFMFIQLYGANELQKVGAFEFSAITGFAISFSIEYEGEPEPVSVDFSSKETMIPHVESGTPYKGLSITPKDDPHLLPLGERIVKVSSLTIWYSC